MLIILRVINRLKEFSFLLFAKVRYGNRFLIGRNVRFHKGTSLVMDDKSRFSVGNSFFARDYFYIRIENGNVEIGDNVFFNNFCSVNSVGGGILIGDNCIFGENVRLYDHNHNYMDENSPIRKQGFSSGKISIGENVWIGSNVTILKDVSIGSNCVIGAGSVVFRNIPDNSILLSNGTIKAKKG